MKEASVKKLFIKVFSGDGSAKSLMVDETMSCGYVTRVLADKNHQPPAPHWALMEHLPDLHLGQCPNITLLYCVYGMPSTICLQFRTVHSCPILAPKNNRWNSWFIAKFKAFYHLSNWKNEVTAPTKGYLHMTNCRFNFQFMRFPVLKFYSQFSF